MNDYLKYLITAFAHFVALIAGVVIVFLVQGNSGQLRDFDFLVWDAIHYQRIVNEGYDMSSVAFSGFPVIWKFAGLSSFGISLCNAVIFLVASAYVALKRNISRFHYVCFLSIPSVIFMFLPYAESMTFLFGALFLLSLDSKSCIKPAIYLFCVTLFKPTLSVLLPAIIITELVVLKPVKSSYVRLFWFLGAILLASALVLFVQYNRVGDVFAFFKAQANWGNSLQFPKFPLSTWNQSEVIWMDAFAFYFALICLIFLIRNYLRNRLESDSDLRILTYSALFVFGAFLYVLLFRDGMLFSLNRFVFATPFALVILGKWNHFAEVLTKKRLYWIIPALLCSTFIFGSYLHFRSFIFYLIFSGVLLVIFTGWLVKEGRLKFSPKIMRIFIVAVLFAAQIFYAVSIINGHWLA